MKAITPVCHNSILKESFIKIIIYLSKQMGIPSYSGNIEKAKALGIEASKTQNLDLKKEELAILEELFHAHSAEYAPGLLYILAEHKLLLNTGLPIIKEEELLQKAGNL